MGEKEPGLLGTKGRVAGAQVGCQRFSSEPRGVKKDGRRDQTPGVFMVSPPRYLSEMPPLRAPSSASIKCNK